MCGVLGIIAKHAVAGDLIHGLSQLQHRGQDAVGLLTYSIAEAMSHRCKRRGLVRDLKEEWLEGLAG
ncbi:MAG: amidophosphoribosyltransferase, partial [Chlamydiia bacterium]|nr:amidophosphoribosyltransferase [Chlamydiia bacterium]